MPNTDPIDLVLPHDRTVSIAYTGPRPSNFAGYDESHPAIVAVKPVIVTDVRSAYDFGYTNHIVGLALGFDTWIGEAVVRLREELGNQPDTKPLRLIGAIPFLGQASLWLPEAQERWRLLCRACDELVIVNTQQHLHGDAVKHFLEEGWGEVDYAATETLNAAKLLKARNDWMVENSSALMAYWDGRYRSGTAHAVRAALKRGNTVMQRHPFTLLLQRLTQLAPKEPGTHSLT